MFSLWSYALCFKLWCASTLAKHRHTFRDKEAQYSEPRFLFDSSLKCGSVGHLLNRSQSGQKTETKTDTQEWVNVCQRVFQHDAGVNGMPGVPRTAVEH